MKNKNFTVFLNAMALLVLVNFLHLETKAQQISVIKVYPSTLRIEKGKSKTLTAVAFDSNRNYIQNLNFNFFSNNTSIVTIEKSREGNIYSPPTYFSKNLADAKTGTNAGATTVYASLNGINSNAVTVLVDDPAAAPTAVINGDNDASGGLNITAKVGEPIEINAENSQGVKNIEWNWGDGDKTTELLSATHAYLQTGNYTLQLTIKNSSGATSTSSVTVNIQNHIACDASNTIIVNSVSALQTAYNNLTSVGGKCLLMPPGIYDGNLVLQPKNFSEFVTIGTTATLPDLKNRITPDSTSLITIRSELRGVEALNVNNGIPNGNKAGKIRFSGIKFDPKHDDWTTDIDAYYIVKVGDYETTTVASQNPERVIFQHCVLNPPNNIEIAHGLLNNGYKLSVISSWFGNIKTRSAGDSQAIFALSGRGSHVYNNNFLEAGSETILYGGTGCITNNCTIDGIVPTNIEMRRNFFTKRLSWRTDYAYGEISVKNLFETKTGRRIYAEGNLMTNHWDDYENQASALVFKSAVGSSAGGYLWNVTEDVVFENNRISHIQGGIGTVRDVDSGQITDYDPLKVSNIRFKNNVFDDSAVERFGAPQGKAWFIFAKGVDDFYIDHTTMIDPRDNVTGNGERALYFDDINSYRFKITNSIIALNEYGFSTSCGGGIIALNVGGGGGVPDPCISNVSPSWIVSTNVFPKIGNHNINSFPSNNFYPENYSGVGLANYVRCDSNTELCDQPITNFECIGAVCNNAGSDGLDIGANIPLVAQRIACSESGIGTNCSTSIQTPYPGPNAPNIPITLEIENFDNGGQNVAYNENNGNTGSGVYRSTPVEAVDIQARSTASNGYVVFEASAGEWLEYTINVPVARKYDIGVRYASEFNNGKFHIEIDGVDVTGQMNVVSTGTWGTFKNLTKRGVMISAGTHIVRLALDTNSPDGCGCIVGNFDAIRFTSTLYDFDADGRADISLFRPSANNWYLDRSSAGFTAVSLGASTDIIAPGDFDGDGKTDVSVFRPSNGTWYRYNSSNSGFVAIQFGQNGDVPVQADYDGDGKSDIAVWRPSNGGWYYLKSSDGSFVGASFGQNNDKPAVGDFDGDGKSDLAVFRPSNGYWYILNSSNAGVTSVSFGAATDNITPADYDGDGKTDIAVFRPSNGTWYLQRSLLGFTGVAFGQSGDIAVPADYDGDGKVDVGIFRPSTGEWSLLRSTEGITAKVFGQSGDVPIPSTYVR
jgi:Carbohydrate binding module (family 6)/PKD domain/FG-GAP-like repeat